MTPTSTPTTSPFPSVPLDQKPAQHGIKAHSDGGWGLVPVQTRSDRFHSTDVEDFPPVTGMELEWRLTPVKQLQDLLAGELDGSRYDYEVQNEGAQISWLDRTDPVVGSTAKPEERASANAWTFFGEALAVSIPADADGARVSIRRDSMGSTPRAAHTVITAGTNSSGIVVIENHGDARLSENVEIVVEDGAQLTVVSVQQWEDEAQHLASHFATVGRDAQLKHVVVTLGGSIVRVNPSVHLNAQGGDTEVLGLYFADAHQHLEHRVFVNHDAPHTRSRVTYKGALQGKSARTVWIGDVLIRPTATGTDSYEQNRNLVLTPGARADSVPNLEIETGDIQGAGHASTTGRFDDEQLFYLQSRGITEAEARRLVVRGFLVDIIHRIDAPELRERLLAAIDAELQAGIEAALAEGGR